MAKCNTNNQGMWSHGLEGTYHRSYHWLKTTQPEWQSDQIRLFSDLLSNKFAYKSCQIILVIFWSILNNTTFM